MILASEENIFFQIWERKKIEITLHTFDKLSMINCDQIPKKKIPFFINPLCVNLSAAEYTFHTGTFFYVPYIPFDR